jgi:hypothetical protein
MAIVLDSSFANHAFNSWRINVRNPIVCGSETLPSPLTPRPFQRKQLQSILFKWVLLVEAEHLLLPSQPYLHTNHDGLTCLRGILLQVGLCSCDFDGPLNEIRL